MFQDTIWNGGNLQTIFFEPQSFQLWTVCNFLGERRDLVLIQVEFGALEIFGSSWHDGDFVPREVEHVEMFETSKHCRKFHDLIVAELNLLQIF